MKFNKNNNEKSGESIRFAVSTFENESNRKLLEHAEQSRNKYLEASQFLRDRLNKECGRKINSLRELQSCQDLGVAEITCLVDELEKASYQPLVFDILATLRVPQSRLLLDRLIIFWENNPDIEIQLALLNVFEVSCTAQDIPKLESIVTRISNKALLRSSNKALSHIRKR